MLRTKSQNAKVSLGYAKLGRTYCSADIMAIGVVFDGVVVGRAQSSERVVGLHETHQRIDAALKEPVPLGMLPL